jgi:arsenite-transporting ATPase
VKIFFFAGKGGVGKSTTSALFAVKLARSGLKVLLNSIDPAHNLGDIFHTSFGPKPRTLLPNLQVMETDLETWVKKYLKQTEADFKAVYKYQEAFNLHKYFRTLKYSPGLEEYAVLLALTDTVESYRDRDIIIFDTPPTALTLKFLALPQVSLLWLKELIRFRRAILDKKEIVTRIKSGSRGREVENDSIMAKIEAMVVHYEKFNTLLQHPGLTRMFVVLNPDPLAVAETDLICRELKELGIEVPFLLVNKYQGQEELFARLGDRYPASRLLTLPRHPEGSVTGLEALEALTLPCALEDI